MMREPYYQDSAVTIYHGDCREIVPTLGQFDLLLTDPPYGKVHDADFDHEWTNRPAMLASCKEWRDVMVPAMKPNATLWWFAWPSLAGRIEALVAEKLNPLAHVVWVKPAPRVQKASPEALRAPVHETERILMFEHYGADNMALGESGYVAKCDELRGFVFEPLRAYLAGEWEKAGKTRQDAERATGTQMAGHWFSRVQWALPTAQHYATLQRVANEGGAGHLRREYEDLRRYFDCRTGDQKTDVWRFAPETRNVGHPTPKPLPLISYMVRLSCRPGGTILDPFAGRGTTGRAAKDLGRKAVLIEREEQYCETAARFMAQEVLPLDYTQPLSASAE
jgi:adenine-specific DNA-methyltransferase